MEYNIYAIKDLKVRAFMQPFFMANDETAKRSFAYAINDSRADQLYMAREDLELWNIGTFDDKKGIITNSEPTIIVNAGEMVYRKEQKTNEVSDSLQ